MSFDRTEQLLAVVAIQNEIVAAGLDLDAVMALVTRRAEELTNADAAVVELVQGDEMLYRTATGTVAEHVGLRLPRTGSLSGLCVEEGAVLRCDDAATDDRVDGEACRRVGATSMVCVPLAHEGAAIGVLKVMSGEPASFGDADVEVLGMLSGVIAAHMSNANKFAVADRASREDTLTGLGNRRDYDDVLEQEVARAQRHDHSLSLVLFDLDGFKQVNDSRGHPAGDEILCQVAALLRGGRLSDALFRVGGDEFAIVMPSTTAAQARVAAKRLSAMVAQARLAGGMVTTSFGIGEHAGGDAEALHAAADADLYRAKAAQRTARV